MWNFRSYRAQGDGFDAHSNDVMTSLQYAIDQNLGARGEYQLWRL